MRECHNCQVKINGKIDKCPLCKNTLYKDQATLDIFPLIPTLYEKNKKLLLSLIIASIITCIISLLVNYLTTVFMWSIFVVLGLASFWLLLISALKLRRNKIKSIFSLTLIISCLVLLLDYFTGWHKWSIDFVLPALFSFQIIASILLAIILKIRASDWLFYLFLENMFGLIPIILIYQNVLRFIWPSFVCIIISGISVCGMIIFWSKNLIDELVRRFHV